MNVASNASYDQLKSREDFTNHDIPRTVRKAWKLAIKNVLVAYLNTEDAKLSRTDQMAIKTAITDLASDNFADQLFLSVADSKFPTALDLSGNPLPAVTNKEQLYKAGTHVINVLREHAQTKTYLSQVPECLYSFCADHLIQSMTYFYVEIAIKHDEKACKQIMYRIAQDSWVLMHRIENHIKLTEVKTEKIKRKLEAGFSQDQLAHSETQDLLRSLSEKLFCSQEDSKIPMDVQIQQRNILEYGLLESLQILVELAKDGDIASLAAIRDTDPIESASAFNAERKRIDQFKRSVNELNKVSAEHELSVYRGLSLSACRIADFELAEEAANHILDCSDDKFDAYILLGYIELKKLNFSGAKHNYGLALSIAITLDQKMTANECLAMHSMITFDQKSFVAYMENSVSICKELGQEKQLVSKLNLLSIAHFQAFDIDKAIKFQLDSIDLARTLCMHTELASHLNNITGAYFVNNELSKAKKCANEAIGIAEQFGIDKSVALGLKNLGQIAQKENDFKSSRNYHSQARDIYRKIDAKSHFAEQLYLLSFSEESLGQLDAATNCAFQAISIYHDLDKAARIAACYYRLGSLYHACNKIDKAIQYYSKAAKTNSLESVHAPLFHYDYGNALITKCNYSAAETSMRESLAINIKLKRSLNIANTLSRLGFITNKQARYGNSVKFYHDATKLYLKLNENDKSADQLNNIISITSEHMNDDRTVKFFMSF